MPSLASRNALHALDLPEIVSRIAFYMDATDVLSSSSVSKSFHQLFTPFVWHDLHFGKPCTLDVDQQPLARMIPLQHSARGNTTKQGQEQDEPDEPSQILVALQDKAPHMRALTFHSHDSALPLQVGRTCSQLESLTIEGLSLKESDNHSPEYWVAFKGMLLRNRSRLRTLSLLNWTFEQDTKPIPGQPVWNPILKCIHAPSLRSLSLENCRIRGRHLKAFWAICSRLEELSMFNVDLDISLPPVVVKRVNKEKKKEKENEGDTFSSPTSEATLTPMLVRFPRLRELSLRSIIKSHPLRQLELLICHCPVLQTLNWNIHHHQRYPTTEFIDHFMASKWPQLDSIAINSQGKWVTDEDYRRVLQAAKIPLRRLELQASRLHSETFRVLQTRHFATIQSIDLIYCDGNVSSWVIDVLTLCPALQKFQAKILNAKDILKSKPWVCHGLQELKVFIDMGFPNKASTRRFTEEELQECRYVFAHLAVFKDLRVLDLLGSYSSACMTRLATSSAVHARINARFVVVALPFRRRAGMDMLVGLKRLERVSYWGGSQPVHKRDLMWMLHHWKVLRTLTGGWNILFGSAKDVEDNYFCAGILHKFLTDHGVQTTGSRFDFFQNTTDDMECEDCWGSSDEEEDCDKE